MVEPAGSESLTKSTHKVRSSVGVAGMDKLVSKLVEGNESTVQVAPTHKAPALKIRLKNKTLSISTQNDKLNIYIYSAPL